MIAEAWRDLKRNPVPVYVYVLSMMVAGGLFSAIDQGVSTLFDADKPPAWVGLYGAAMQVAFAALAATFQAGVFAFLGRELDKPLWKCEDTREAVRRFFMPWFTINLIAYAILMGEVRAAEAESEGLFLLSELGLMVVYMLAIPVGACVMFYGRFRWSEVPAALTPLAAQARLTIGIALVGMLGYLCHAFYLECLVRGYWTPILGPALIQMPFTAIELVQFAAAWELCRLNRDAGVKGMDPYDF